MTMLMRWLFLATVILGPWMAVLTNRYQSPWVDQNRHTLLLYPFALIAAFGIYSVGVIAWRVYSFNDCQEASDELRKRTGERRSGPDSPVELQTPVARRRHRHQELRQGGAGDTGDAVPGGPEDAVEGRLEDVLAGVGDLAIDGDEPEDATAGAGDVAVDGTEAAQSVLPDSPDDRPRTCPDAAATDLDRTDPADYRRREAALLAALTLPREEDCVALERRTRHDRDAWFAARRGRITASVFQRVSNQRPSTSCTNLLETLLYGAGRQLDLPALQYGRRHEEQAVAEYERQTGRPVRRPVGLVVHPRLGFVAATPDGVVSDDLILEVKCPQRAENASLQSVAEAGGSGFCLDRELKLRRGHTYYCQVQVQLACCGARYCDFFVWTPRETACDRIEFDPDYWEEKLGRVEEFYFECVLPEMVDPRRARGLPYRERQRYIECHRASGGGGLTPESDSPAKTRRPGPDSPAKTRRPGPDSPAKTRRPGPDSPAKTRRPGPDSPAKTRRPGPDSPAESRRPGPDSPAKTRRPGPDSPAESRRPGPDSPAESRRPGPDSPAESRRPGPDSPAKTRRPGPDSPAESRRPGPDSPAESRRPGPDSPAESRRPGPDSPAESLRAGPNSPAESRRSGPDSPAESRRPGPDSPAESRRPGPDSPAESRRPGPDSPAESRRSGPDSPAESRRPGPDSPAESRRPGPDSPAESRRPGPDSPAESRRPGPDSPAESRRPGPDSPVELQTPGARRRHRRQEKGGAGDTVPGGPDDAVEGGLEDVLAGVGDLAIDGDEPEDAAAGAGDVAVGGTEAAQSVLPDSPGDRPRTCPDAAATDLDRTDPADYRRREAALLAALTLPREEDCVALERRTRHDRDAWFAARRGRITASVFQRVSNQRPSTSCTNLLETLLYGAGRQLDLPALQYGRRHEEQAVAEYERKTGRPVRRPVGLVVHPRLGFVAATPDGVVSDDLILEVKCPQRAENSSLQSVAEAGGSGFCLDRELKLRRGHSYYCQVQVQLACCGARYCDFFVWTPRETACDRIEFDPDYWEEKLGRVEEFYFECVLPEMVDPRRARGLPYRERQRYIECHRASGGGGLTPESDSPAKTRRPGPDSPAKTRRPGPDSPAKTRRPGPDSPAKTRRPGPDSPAKTRRPGPDSPAESRRPGPDSPAKTRRPGPDSPAESRRPGPDSPAESRRPGPDSPAESRRPGPDSPAKTRRPGPDSPAESRRPGPDSPAESRRPGPDSPAESRRPGPDSPAESRRPGPNSPAESRRSDPDSPAESRRPGPDSPAESRRPGPDSPAESRRPGPDSPAESRRPGPDSPAESRRPGPDSPVELQTPGARRRHRRQERQGGAGDTVPGGPDDAVEGGLEDVLAGVGDLAIDIDEPEDAAAGAGDAAVDDTEAAQSVLPDSPGDRPRTCPDAAATDLDRTDPADYRRREAALLAALTLPREEDRVALERRTRHDRDAWFAARRGRITASVFQRVSNQRPSTSCTNLLETLLYGAGRQLDLPALQYGRRHEEQAVAEYERKTGRPVRRPVGLVVHPRLGFVAATPDGVVSDDLILEVKCPQRAENASLQSVAEAGGSGFCLDRELKLRRGHTYYCQVQVQLACCGARYCDFFVWTPRETACDRIEFDPDYWEEKLGRVQEFYSECVLPEMVDPRKARGLPYRERQRYSPKRS